ncbi:MAG: Qat anti-phage system associated protein QatB [Thermomicrobiales bacterium]
MGTSSSYAGPKGRQTLLPPWADLPPDDDTDTPRDSADTGREPASITAVPPDVSWRSPKTIISRLGHTTVGGTASIARLRTLGRSYVRASGGARTAAAAAISGRAATARLGGVFAAGIRDGFAVTVERLDLGILIGQDAETVLVEFIGLLAPDGASVEEAAARRAIIETLDEVFVTYGVETDGLDALDRLNAEALAEIVTLSMVNYVNARLQFELVNRLEAGRMPEADANRLMGEIRGFIRETVRYDFANVDVVSVDWEGPEGQQFVARVYEAGYALLGEER